MTATVRPFRFGVQSSRSQTGASWRAFAQRCESIGYDTLYTSDHLFDQLSPIASMAFAADATERITLGCLVFGNDYRHPVVLAREIATIDVLSSGRVEFGLGAGWMKADYEAAGLAYDPPGVRISRLGEALAVMKSLWSTGAAQHDGEHYHVHGELGLPLTVSRPHPRILIGGGGRRVLGLAAREADVVNLSPQLTTGAAGREATDSTVAARYDERIAWVREAAGARFDDLELQILVTFVDVGPNRTRAIQTAADRFGLSPADVAEWPRALIGSVDEVVAQLLQRRERFGVSSWVVRDSRMEAFAPVVAALAGR